MRQKIIALLAITAIFASCKKPYLPPVITAPNSYLVVEGVINSGSDSTTIKLSRTVNLSSNVTNNPELHAVVAVESDQNAIFPLKETQNGHYVSPGLNLDNTRNYRLRITTADNQVYLSDFVAVLNSPPIDSVNYTTTSNTLNVFSNAHDATNKVKYYRWDYQETWIIHSNYFSYFISNGDTILARDLVNDEIYACWSSDTSSNIVIGSTAKLAQDVVANNPITSVSSTSEKLGSEYSILVRQYALTGDAYNFWTNLKKNTEQLGSIFDSEPSQIDGNIHCISTPSLAVIGYVSVGGVASQRIFIHNQQLPAWLPTNYDPSCQLDTFLYKYYAPGSKIPVNQVDQILNYHNGPFYPEIPILPIAPPGSPPIGYTGSDAECVDCTLRGSNKEPVFWKY